jgi:hypothetical protein
MTGFGKPCRTAQLTYHKSKILHAQQILHWTGVILKDCFYLVWIVSKVSGA